jgi:hypothetical protein
VIGVGEVAGRRMTVEIEGDFVVFLIGARFSNVDVWREYWRRVGRTGRTGIWRETFLVKAGQYEAVYGNMPPRGLGKAGRLHPASEASTARARLDAVPG